MIQHKNWLKDSLREKNKLESEEISRSKDMGWSYKAKIREAIKDLQIYNPPGWKPKLRVIICVFCTELWQRKHWCRCSFYWPCGQELSSGGLRGTHVPQLTTIGTEDRHSLFSCMNSGQKSKKWYPCSVWVGCTPPCTRRRAKHPPPSHPRKQPQKCAQLPARHHAYIFKRRSYESHLFPSSHHVRARYVLIPHPTTP